MAETAPLIDYVAYGPLDRMVAEFSTFNPVRDGLMAERQAKYAVTVVGEADWDSEYFANLSDAKAEAEHLAAAYGVTTSAI